MDEILCYQCGHVTLDGEVEVAPIGYYHEPGRLDGMWKHIYIYMITWTHTHIDIHMLWTVRYMHMMHIFWTIRPGGSVETVCIMCHGTWTGKQCGALLMTRWVRSASCVSFIWRHGSWFQRLMNNLHAESLKSWKILAQPGEARELSRCMLSHHVHH